MAGALEDELIARRQRQTRLIQRVESPVALGAQAHRAAAPVSLDLVDDAEHLTDLSLGAF